MACNIDYFSLLPQSILITILSLLPIKDSIRTSVLAKSWRNLWRQRTTIVINERHFLTLQNTNNPRNPNMYDDEMKSLKKNQQNICIKFGDEWLWGDKRQEFLTAISSFSLTFSDPSDYYIYMLHFIHLALYRRTKSLELDFSCLDWESKLPLSDSGTYKERFELPDVVYRHGSLLESLKLVSCNFRGNGFVNLGCALKSVAFGWIWFTGLSQLTDFVTNCPVLESLSLFKCFNLTDYVIESRCLKCLVVDKCVDLLNLSVAAPKLACFKYCGSLVEFGFINFPCLDSVDLDFGLVGMLDEDDGDKVASLLVRLRNASSLTVCAYACQVLPLASNVPWFGIRPYAKNMTIKTAFHESEFYGILLHLSNYTSVEKLRFEVDDQRIDFKSDEQEDLAMLGYDRRKKLQPLTKGNCLTNRVKLVEMEGLRGIPNEIEFLIFVIKYGCELQKLVLKVAKDDDGKAISCAMGFKQALMQQHISLDVVVTVI